MPVIGYLAFTSPDERPTLLAAFLKGLEKAGYVVGQNVAIEYRSARGHEERLPALVAELLKLPATVIAATGGEAVGGLQRVQPRKFQLCSRPAAIR